jgi:hypothetical protein
LSESIGAAPSSGSAPLPPPSVSGVAATCTGIHIEVIKTTSYGQEDGRGTCCSLGCADTPFESSLLVRLTFSVGLEENLAFTSGGTSSEGTTPSIP